MGLTASEVNGTDLLFFLRDSANTWFNTVLKTTLGNLNENYLSEIRIRQAQELLRKRTPFNQNDIELANIIILAQQQIQAFAAYIDLRLKDDLLAVHNAKCYEDVIAGLNNAIKYTDISHWFIDRHDKYEEFTNTVVNAFYEAFDANSDNQEPLIRAISDFVKSHERSLNEGTKILVEVLKKVASGVGFQIEVPA